MVSDWPARFSAYGKRAGGGETRAFLQIVGKPGIISFAGGIPDAALFPSALIADAHARVFADPVLSRAALQYSNSEGYAPLRERIVEYMRGKGVNCGVENVLITNGSQQALYLTGRLLVGEGDGVLTERPTYLGLLHAFAGCNPSYGPLAALKGKDRVNAKLAYAMPDFANPSGESYSLPAREALLAGAEVHDAAILEDGAYTDLRYAGAPLPSLLALDTQARGIERTRVIYSGTFSKTISPGLRTGWVVAASPVIEKMGLLKQASDFHVSALTQMVLADVVQRLPQSHIAGLCETYGVRLGTMLDGLAAHMPASASWTKPEGGMFVWVSLPETIDTGELLKAALAEGIAYVPGASFFPADKQHNHLRLNFTACPPETIRAGIARLAALIAQATER